MDIQQSAPPTAGNFAKLVVHGAYDGAKLDTINQAIITDTGLDKNSILLLPLRQEKFWLRRIIFLTKGGSRFSDMPLAGGTFLGRSKPGDVIRSAKMVDGQDRLILPTKS
ncbi:unnamed protein product [Linum trigynum]|uniref:Uncharacterized protein n=1 Tax=Linum trigynum TaxID=586398 RepID=A0AAV2EI10_9ROSI